MGDLRESFIQNEIWTLTFQASFSRGHVYAENIGENDRIEFKRAIRDFITIKILTQYG
jgi:hypothetical protein